MATTITVLSWNIESFGAAKAATLPPKVKGAKPPPPSKSQIVDFIATVAKGLKVDVLGIMEVKSGIGLLLNSWLLSALNNNGTPNTIWKGAVSSRQDGGTQEEYIYLWKSTVNFDLNMAGLPGPTSLINVADEQAFAGLFQAAGITTAANQTAFLQSLAANSYITKGVWKVRSSNKSTKTLRVNPNFWQFFKNGNSPTFNAAQPQPPVAFNPQQLTQIGTILTQLDVLRFITYGDRSPYLINLTLDTKPLTLALYHAPGPQDPDRLPAINNIGMSLPLAPAATDKNMLLMGDFNISSAQLTNQARAYQRAPVNANAVNFTPVNPQQMVTIFSPITGAPLNTGTALLPSPTYTSLTSKFLDNTATLQQTQGNIYDNFYYHQSVTAANQITVTNKSAKVALPLTAFYAGPGQPFNQQITTSLMVFFRAFQGAAFLQKSLAKALKVQAAAGTAVRNNTTYLRTANTNLANAGAGQNTNTLQTRVNKCTILLNAAKAKNSDATDAVTSLQGTQTCIGNPFNNTPAGVGDALTIYRYAISDHLAISFQLQS